MGCSSSQSQVRAERESLASCYSEGGETVVNEQINNHAILPDIQVHSVISYELDHDHVGAQGMALGDCSDEQLVAELAERQLNPDTSTNYVFDLETHLRNALNVPLEAVSNDELFAEVARRRLDLRERIGEEMVLERYEIGKLLGHGASGRVYLAKNKDTGELVACKVIEKDLRMNDAQSMSTEVEIMKRVRHEHVASLYEIFQNTRCMWLILELVDGGDLRSFLIEHRSKYTENMAAVHMKQVLKGVHYLHSIGVVHRDLKLENILLKRSPENDVLVVKIADFGLSALCRVGENGYHNSKSSKRKHYNGLHEPWGTAEYEAPELLDGAYGPQADMWALGCMLYEMLGGQKCFYRYPDERTLSNLHNRIRKGEIDFSRTCWWSISVNAKDFIKRLLEVDPRKRLSASEALRHRWIRTLTAEGEQSATNPPNSPVPPGATEASASPILSPRKSSPSKPLQQQQQQQQQKQQQGVMAQLASSDGEGPTCQEEMKGPV